MSLNNDTRHLSSIALFSHFEEEQLRLLAFGSDTMRYAEGTEIFREGQASDGGYYIVDGSVELTLADYPQRAAKFGPGDLLGEMAMITRNKRVGTAVAKTDCQLLRISRATLIRVLEEFPHLAIGIQQQISSSIENFTTELSRVERLLDDVD